MDYLKRLPGLVKKALQDYRMIRSGDRVAVGLSGGKDSMTLLSCMQSVRAYYPWKYELTAIFVDLGYPDTEIQKMRSLCDRLGVELRIVPTNIGDVSRLYAADGSSPCAICANMRRGALNREALAAGCSSVALAHSRNDVVETLLMSLFREGRINTFAPVTELSRTGLRVIRPLIFAEEREVMAYMKASDLTPVSRTCPYDGHTERSDMRVLLAQMEKDHPDVINTVFGAVARSNIDGWNVNR